MKTYGEGILSCTHSSLKHGEYLNQYTGNRSEILVVLQYKSCPTTMADNKIPRSINLLEPVNAPEDIWEKIYDWLFNVGKYLLISVEVIVLVVFFSRFAIDRKNNDLTDLINEQVDILNGTYYRTAELRFINMHLLFSDLKKLETDQLINSSLVSSVQEGIPSDVELQRFTYSAGKISMAFTADDFESIQNYESTLRSNPLYEDVKVSLSKSGESSSKIDFAVNFALKGTSTPLPDPTSSNTNNTDQDN